MRNVPTVSRLQARKFRGMAGQFPTFTNQPGVKRAVKLKGPRTKKVRSITKAKTLTREQFDNVIIGVNAQEHAARNSALFHLSYFCALRVQEIAGLRWKRNILTADGKIADVIHITKDIGKRTKERFMPVTPELRAALERLRKERPRDRVVIYPIYNAADTSERAAQNEGHVDPNTLAKYMGRIYTKIGYDGCTSHSGRRTAITGWAQNCNAIMDDQGERVGASIWDVQLLAGHANIATTAGYIEASPQLKRLAARVFE